MMPPWGGVPGIPIWEATQDMLERLYISAGLGTIRGGPRGVGEGGWGEECLGFLAETAAL